MPLHGPVPARIFRVLNGWWPYRPWGTPVCAKRELRPAGQSPPAFAKPASAGEGRSGDGSFGNARPPPTPPPGDFKSPGPPLSASQGPPLVGIETPFWPFWFTWQRRGPFCLAQDPSIRAWHGPCGNTAGNPGGLVGPPPPLRHQPRPPGCRFLDLPQAPQEGLYLVQALYLPGLRGFGRRRRRNPSPSGPVPDMDFAGPSNPAWTGPAAPGLSIRAAGEVADWVAKREGPRKLERRDPAPVPGNDDSAPLVLVLIPRVADHDPTSRLTKVFGPKRALWRCGASRGVRDAVRKPW